MHPNYFNESLPIVAAALGRKLGVRIEVGGSAAYTDGESVHLPILDESATKHREALLGLLCHECAHLRFTDFTLDRSKTPAFERSIDNALEDCRIEREMRGLYAGAETLFKAAHDDVIKDLERDLPKDLNSLLPLFLLATTELQILRRSSLQAVTDGCRSILEKRIGKTLVEKLEMTALKIKDAKSTKDVQSVRKAIMKLLKSTSEKASKASTDAGSEKKSDGQSSTGKGSQPRASQKSSSQKGKSSSNANSATEGDTTNKEKEMSGNGTSGEAETSSRQKSALVKLLASTDKAVKNPLDLSGRFKAQSALAQKPEDNPHYELKIDTSGKLRPFVRDKICDRERGLQHIERAKADSKRLQHVLRSLCEAKTRVSCRTSERGRSIQTMKLHRLAVGNACVFRSESEKRAPHMAVHVLLDLSGSMGDSPATLAIRTTLGLIYAMGRIRGVNPALSVFPGNAAGRRYYATVPIIRHGETLASVAPEDIGTLDSFGSTPLPQALLAADVALSACREEAKTLIVITDGAFGKKMGQTELASLARHGVRCLGIQIASENSISNLIKESACIEDISALPTVLFSFAKRIFT